MPMELYKMDIGGLHGGAWNQISLHFRVDNTGSDPNLNVAQDLVNDWDTEKQVDYRDLFPNEYGVEWVKARRVSAGGGKTRFLEYPGSAGQGTRAGDTASLSISPVVKLVCGMGANTQGRIFLPAVAEADLNENVYDAGYITQVVTFFGGLTSWSASGGSGRTWELCVLSRKLASYFPVASVSVSDIIGNQRKRRVPR